jgi:hypothetical protein
LSVALSPSSLSPLSLTTPPISPLPCGANGRGSSAGPGTYREAAEREEHGPCLRRSQGRGGGGERRRREFVQVSAGSCLFSFSNVRSACESESVCERGDLLCSRTSTRAGFGFEVVALFFFFSSSTLRTKKKKRRDEKRDVGGGGGGGNTTTTTKRTTGDDLVVYRTCEDSLPKDISYA